MSEHAKFVQYLQEELNKEDIGENIDIMHKSDSLFFAYDKKSKTFYRFFYDDNDITEISNNQDLWIVDENTLEFSKLMVPIAERAKNSYGQARISFAEKCIKEFIKIPNKENIVELLREHIRRSIHNCETNMDN